MQANRRPGGPMKPTFLTSCFFVAALLAACESSNTSGTGGSSTTSSSTSGTGGAGGDPTPSNSCIRPGDKGNNLGVGEYCTPLGKECVLFDNAPLCLADVGQDQWMCTRIGCDATTDCGEGAGCLMVDGQGSACVPCRCDDRGIGCKGGTGGAGGAGGMSGTGGAGGTSGAGGTGGMK